MNLAHATHLFINNHVTPKLQPLGYVRRKGKLGSSVVANRLELRTALFLCPDCQRKMPVLWCRRYEYRRIDNLYADHSRCDNCQGMGPTDVFTPEDGGYYQEYAKLTGISERARAQQATIRDGRRIKGT